LQAKPTIKAGGFVSRRNIRGERGTGGGKEEHDGKKRS
jgi:hypothetical protein